MAKKRNLPPPFAESIRETRRAKRKAIQLLVLIEEVADAMGKTPIQVCEMALRDGIDARGPLETFRALEQLDLERAIEGA